MRILTNEQIKSVINLHVVDCWSVYKIANHFNASSGFIRKTLINNNINIKPRFETDSHTTKLSYEDELFIVNHYKTYQNKSYLASHFKTSKHKIASILKKHNVALRKGRFLGNYLSEDQKQQLITMYVSGQGQETLAKTFEISSDRIRRILETEGIPVRPRVKHSLNQEFFQKIDSFHKAYFLGLLYADGCNSCVRNYNTALENEERVGRVTISLQSRDGYLLEQFKESLEYSGPITRFTRSENRQDGIRLSICDKRLAIDLYNLGMTPRKSFTLKFPTCEMVPEQFLSAVILGYFDGDGCFSVFKSEGYIKQCFSIIGSKDFIPECAAALRKHCDVDISLYSRRCKNDNSVMTLKCCKTTSLLNIFHFLYRSAPFFLKRKYDKFLEFINSKPEIHINYLISIDPYWEKLKIRPTTENQSAIS